ncbi:urea transporter [Paenibacillus antarcticus]|uniref:urea transporter n=1 Tax=Paenibacillus antarcticus TaxID=253703 RepID=UPI001B801F65|nr:urea transporter [Paenibacillus antarcticus]
MSATLKGISQVILIDNPITGLIILVAIMISDISLGIVALLSAMIGTWIGYIGGKDKAAVNQGIFGYNSVLAGIALFLFLGGELQWVIALVGAAVVTLITAAMMYVLSSTVVPVLTLPYIMLTWTTVLSSYHLKTFHLSPELVPQDLIHLNLDQGENVQWLNGLIDGIGQVYFQENMWSGVLILIGICWAGWRLALYAVIGTLIAWLTAYGLGAEITSLNLGLYGFNGVLTILAVSGIYSTGRRLELLRGMIAVILTVPVTAGVTTWLNPYGLTSLTLPFVLVTWLFITTEQILPELLANKSG